MTAANRALAAALRVRAIAQTGLAYGRDPYDLERYQELAELAALLVSDALDVPQARIADLFVPERGYPTPKVDVRGGVFRDGEVLLVREASDGLWTLPGGWADEHDTPSRAVEREVAEEGGVTVRALKLVALKDRHEHPYQPRHLFRIYKLFFLCELLGGEPQPGQETTAARFFALSDLPPLSLGRTLADDILLLNDHRLDAAQVAYFD